MNEIKISGTVVADAEVKFSPSGNGMVNFSLEIKEPKVSYYGLEGEKPWKYSVLYLGEFNECALPKEGQHITVLGKIYTRSWKVGNEWKSKVGILADQIDLEVKTKEPDAYAEESHSPDWPDDDLPF